MTHLNNIIVALDLTELDDVLVGESIRFAQRVGAGKLVFAHVSKELDYPKEILESYGNVLPSIQQVLTERIEATLHKHRVAESGVAYEIVVREGSEAKGLLKILREFEADLLVMGMKSGLSGTSSLSYKMAKVSQCSLLLLPESVPSQMGRILVPIDMGQHSLRAIEFADQLAQKQPNAQVEALYVYDVPTGYTHIGKSLEDFATIMRDNATVRFEKYKKSLPESYAYLSCEFILGHKDVADRIYKHAIRNRSECIVLASSCKSAAAVLMVGSTAERLIALNKQIPLFIVRDRADHVDFLDALMQL